MSVGWQQTAWPPTRIVRAAGQHVSPPPSPAIAHGLSFGQQPLSQHSCLSGQQWSPQHFLPLGQHVSPQHVAVLGQQWSSKQHFWLFEQHFPLQQLWPFVQHVFPHFFVFGGVHGAQNAFPLTVVQRVRGGQHVFLQQTSFVAQQFTSRPEPHGIVRGGQHWSWPGSAHFSPIPQHVVPHFSWPDGQPTHRPYCRSPL